MKAAHEYFRVLRERCCDVSDTPAVTFERAVGIRGETRGHQAVWGGIEWVRERLAEIQ